MIPFQVQSASETHRGFRSPTKKLGFSCKPGEAPCLESLTSIIPAVIAIFLLFVRLLHPFLRHRPRWTKPFINELNEKEQELRIENKKRYANSTTALLVIIPIGLVLHVAALLYPAYDVRGVSPALAWVNWPKSLKDQELTVRLGRHCSFDYHRSPTYRPSWDPPNPHQPFRDAPNLSRSSTLESGC